jgi:hypothetical protein
MPASIWVSWWENGGMSKSQSKGENQKLTYSGYVIFGDGLASIAGSLAGRSDHTKPKGINRIASVADVPPQ